MERTKIFKRTGKFGKAEYLMPLKVLPIVSKKETEKAYCCGEYAGTYYKDGNPKIDVFGWIAKSMVVEMEGEKYVPTWIIDKFNYTHLMYTNWINEDWKNEHFEVIDLEKTA